jgi:hypothetical protein
MMRKTLLCAILIVSALTAAAHDGKGSGAGTDGMGGHLNGLFTGVLLFLVSESAVLYLTFSTWFKDPDYPVPPSPERFFQAAVFSFVAMVLTGGILTYFFSGVDLAHTPLTAAYGYNNVCVVFDNPPSTYICPVFWFFVAYLIGRYAVEDTKRLVQLTSIGSGVKALFYALNVILVMSVAFFFITLSINPAFDLYGHTIPFIFLILTLPSVALMHWWQLEERSILHTAGVALYMALSLVKATFDIYALSTGHYVPPHIAQSVDVLWMVFALSAPFVMPAPVLKERLVNATGARAAR